MSKKAKGKEHTRGWVCRVDRVQLTGVHKQKESGVKLETKRRMTGIGPSMKMEPFRSANMWA